MNDIDLKKYQDILLKEKADLETKLNSLGRQISPEGDWIVVPQKAEDSDVDEPNQVADVFEEMSADVAVLDVLEQRYKQVCLALEKISNGTYGIDDQGNPINPDRLNADPAVTTNLE